MVLLWNSATDARTYFLLFYTKLKSWGGKGFILWNLEISIFDLKHLLFWMTDATWIRIKFFPCDLYSWPRSSSIVLILIQCWVVCISFYRSFFLRITFSCKDEFIESLDLLKFVSLNLVLEVFLLEKSVFEYLIKSYEVITSRNERRFPV